MSHVPKSYSSLTAEKSYQVQYTEIDTADRPTRRRNWKPFATRLPYIFSLVILLVVAVIALEILIQKSVPVSQSIDQSNQQDVAKRQISVTPDALKTTHPATTLVTNPSVLLQLSTTTTTTHPVPTTTPPPTTTSAPPTTVNTKTVTDPDKLLQLTTTTTTRAPTTPPTTTATPTRTVTNPDQLLQLTTTTTSATPTIVNTKTVTDPDKLLQLTTTTTIRAPTTPPTTTATPTKTVTNPDQLLQLTTTTTPPKAPTTSIKTTTTSPSATEDTNTVPIQTDTKSLLQLTTTTANGKSPPQIQTSSGLEIYSDVSTKSLLQLSSTTTVITGVPSSKSLLQLQSTSITAPTVTNTKDLLKLTTTSGIETASVTNTKDLLKLTTSTTPTIAYTKTDPDEYLQLGTTTSKGSRSSTSGPTVTHSAADTTDASKYLIMGSSTTFMKSSSSYTGTRVVVSGANTKSLLIPTATTSGMSKGLHSSVSGTHTAGQPSTTTDGTTKPTDISLIQKVVDANRLNLRIDGNLTYYTYFIVMYLPSIIAVILRELWNLTASGLKLMEPFYQLSRPEGVSAKDSLLADYLGSTTSLYSLSSAFKGDKKMILITLVNLVINLLAPVSTEAMTAVPNWVVDDEGDLVPRTAYWGSSAVLIRVLQGMLSFTALCILLLALFDWKRRSSLSANPSKIATMASLLGNPHVAQELNNLPPNASDEELAHALAYRGFAVADYRDKHGNYCCGLQKAGETVPQGLHRLPVDDFAASMAYGAVPAADRKGTRPAHRTTAQVVFDAFFLVWITSLLGVVVAYWLDSSNSGFNRFFNSAKFGPRFVLSLGASIAAGTFQSFEREVRLMTPYRELAKGHAPAGRTVLRSVDGTAVSSLVQSIRHGAWFSFFIALVTAFGDILIISVAGIPYNGNTVKEFLHACFFSSMIISGLMILSTLFVFYWRRKNKKLRIPQEPNEILVRVWMSLSNPGNHLRASLGDCGRMSIGDLRHRLKYEGGSYWAGWIRDQHGRNIWCVDKEPEHTHAEFR